MNTRAIGYPLLARVAVASLVAVSRASLMLLVLLTFVDTRLENPLRLMRAFSVWCLLPAFCASLVQRAHASTLTIQSGELVLEQRGRRIEVPCESIAHAIPWTVPLPAGGLWLRLRSGRRFRYGLQVADPVAVIEALADCGAPDQARTFSGHPSALYSRAKSRAPWRWHHMLLKFVVFALVPTLPLFRLHQWIAYGGTFGEYYTYGLKAYLLGFGIYWATVTIDLVLFAAALRFVAEAIALPASYLTPSRTEGVRRAVELGVRIAYYGGVPAILVWRFLLQ